MNRGKKPGGKKKRFHKNRHGRDKWLGHGEDRSNGLGGKQVTRTFVAGIPGAMNVLQRSYDSLNCMNREGKEESVIQGVGGGVFYGKMSWWRQAEVVRGCKRNWR